jgi:hypothetical protein
MAKLVHHIQAGGSTETVEGTSATGRIARPIRLK